MSSPPPIAILPPDAQRAIAAELQPDETLLWAAQPLPRVLRRQSRGMALVGFCFTLFAIFWIVMTARTAVGWAGPHTPRPATVLWMIPLSGLPFLVVGVALLASPLWRGDGAAAVAYTVTNRRAFILHGKVFSNEMNVRSFGSDQLRSLQAIQRTDGSGDLIFEHITLGSGPGPRSIAQGFMGIDCAQDVEQLIRQSLLAGPAAVRAVRAMPVD